MTISLYFRVMEFPLGLVFWFEEFIFQNYNKVFFMIWVNLCVQWPFFLHCYIYKYKKTFIELFNFLLSFIAHYLFWENVVSELISGKLPLK